MYICFKFSESGDSSPPPVAGRIAGQRYALEVFRADGEGPFYPHVAEQSTAESYRFFAGRVAGVPVSSSLPPGHPVSKDSCTDWQPQGEKPEGSWIALKFDRRQDVVSIACDLFCLQRWYYCQCPDGWYFANSLLYLKRLLQHAVHIEPRAVPYMLLFGFLPHQFTPLQNVYALLPGRALIVDGTQAVLSPVEELPVERRPTVSDEEAIPRICAVLESAFRAELAGLSHVVCPLSGGMDSRVALGYALQWLPREQVLTLTFGYPHSLDYRIGTALASQLGVPNLALPVDPRPLGLRLDENFPNTEGMYWVYPDYPVGPMREALPCGCFVLSGYLGDRVFRSVDPPGALSQGQDASTDMLSLIRDATWVVPVESVTALLELDTWDPLGFRAALHTYHGKSLAERFDCWMYANHKANRLNYALQRFRDRAFYLAPFVHRAVFDIAYALSRAQRTNGRTFFAAVKRAFPELYAFPTKTHHGFSHAEGYSWRVNLARAYRRAMQELDSRIGPLFGTILYHHPRNNYDHPRELLRKCHRAEVASALAALAELPVFKRKSLARLRAEYLRGRVAHPMLLRGLLTVHRWMTHYG